MRKLVLSIFFVILTVCLFGSPIDDLRFAIGLYSDENYKLASTELQRFVQQNPESSYLNDARFLLANSLLSLQDYQKADSEFSMLNSPDISPSIRAEVLLGSAQCKYFLKQIDESEKIFKSFVSENSKHELCWKAQYFLGMILADRDEHEGALELFDKAASKQNDPDLNLALLISLIALNQEERAGELIAYLDLGNKANHQFVITYNNYNLQKGRWQKILDTEIPEINSNSQYYSNYYILRGIAEYNLEEYSDAIADLNNVNDEKSNYYIALSYFEKGDKKRASEILVNLRESQDTEIKANSYFYLAKSEDDVQKADEMLLNFTSEFPTSEFVPIAYYLLGYNKFKSNDFIAALNKFSQAAAKAIELNSPNFTVSYQEKNTFLMGESYYLNLQTSDALMTFKNYIKRFPLGIFADEAIFKIGLIQFEAKKLTDATAEFSILIGDFPQSTKAGMSNYYLGEIAFRKEDLGKALIHFNEALKGVCDIGYTWERIARIHFRNKNYQRALESLANIPNDSKYLFEKFLLEGNANFAIRKLDKALQAYEFAEEYARGDGAQEIALSRKAWTLYQMKRFKEASQLYSRLSSSASSPEDYLIKAANAAFSAEDFVRSIEVYKQFLHNFNESEDVPSIQLGIADSYYNLGDFASAAEYYQKLIIPESDHKMLTNSLNGLRWASEQDEKVDFLTIVDELLKSSNDVDFRLELLDRKLHYQYNKANWQESITIADEIGKLSPNYSELSSVNLIKALSYMELKDYDNADLIFQQLGSDKPSAEILYNWALMKLTLSDMDAAIEKLRLASQLSKRMDVWIKLLELEIAADHIYFQNDQARFKEFAKDEYLELADIYLIQWQIKNNQTGFENKLKALGKSKNDLIKANIQFLKGYQLYVNREMDNAVPELLRVRYLFPEFQNIRIQAEKLALDAYLQSSRIEEAKQLFDTIKKDLSEQDIVDFSAKFSKEVE
jgi:TolA-binding protein